MGDIRQTQKRIHPDANSLDAGGVKYIIHPTLTLARYKKFQELQVIAGFGADYSTLYSDVKKAYLLHNQGKFADVAVLLNKILEATARPINAQEDALMLICTLFIAPSGADLSKWSEAEAAEQIRAWEAEGYLAEDFFALALRLVRHFRQNLAGDSQSGTEPIE